MSAYDEVAAAYKAYMAASNLYELLPKEERAAQNERIKAAYAEYEAAKAKAADERLRFQSGSY